MFHKVLVATDGSENAKKAIAYAMNLLRHNQDAKVTLINAFHIPPVGPEPATHWRMAEVFQEYSQSVLDNAAGMFEKENLPVTRVSVEGDPGQAVCQYAREHGYDHIVIGATGHSQLGALLFGSVARKIIQLAPCPVTIIR